MGYKPPSRAWWKKAVVYQVYPSTFACSNTNTDGFGDLKGITSKLDYLKELGIEIIWISPICQSPNKDMGYDISDYQNVDPRYGNLDDWDEMVKKAHGLGIKIVFDLVVNHTSDQHPWFIESRSSLDNPKRDWYIWKKPEFDSDGKAKPINNWKAAFEGSAWEHDEKTKESYLHLFVPEQPDLNWKNPDVRRAVYDMMIWWIKRGVDGFRMDVINLLDKSTFEDAPVTDPDQEYQYSWPRTANGPVIHEYLQEMNREVLSKYDVFSVGECPFDNSADVLIKYSASARKELQMVFQFELVYCDAGSDGMFDPIPFDLVKFKKIIAKWQTCLAAQDGWNSLYLENHDNSRSISRWCDEGKYRARSAKLLAMLNSTLGGTQYVYQGEELGQINMPKDWPIEEYKDVASQNYYHRILEERRAKTGEQNPDMSDILSNLRIRARDHARTPMQWSAEKNAGFSEGEPWMRVHPDFKEWNAEAQIKDKDSVLHFYRKMLKIRKDYDVMTYGSFELLSPDDRNVFAYTRELDNERILVVLNFSGQEQKYEVPSSAGDWSKASLLAEYVENAEAAVGKQLTLQPWEGRTYRI